MILPLQHLFRAKMEQLTRVSRLLPESQDQNRAWTVLCVPLTVLYSLDRLRLSYILALTVLYSLDGGGGETRDVIAALEERDDLPFAAALSHKTRIWL